MDNKILVSISLFSLAQKISVVSNNESKVFSCSLEALADSIIDLCYNYQIYDVVLTGAAEVFENKILNEVQMNELTKYSINKINIEVM